MGKRHIKINELKAGIIKINKGGDYKITKHFRIVYRRLEVKVRA